MSMERKIKRFTNSINLINQKFECLRNSNSQHKSKLSNLSRQLNKSYLELLRSNMRYDFLKSKGAGLKRSDIFDKKFRLKYLQLELLIAQEQIERNELTVSRILNECEIVIDKANRFLKSDITSRNRAIKLQNTKTQTRERKTK